MLKGLTPPEKEYICAFMRKATDLLSKAETINTFLSNASTSRISNAARNSMN
jgi:hypothetical protein